MTSCTETAPHPNAVDRVEWLVAVAALRCGRPVPTLRWCSPETPAEMEYAAAHGGDWHTVIVEVATFDSERGELWVRTDQGGRLTLEQVENLIGGPSC